MQYIPFEYKQFLPQPIRVFSQNSKQSAIPRDYVLILGDSHARGDGDWLLEQYRFVTPFPYQTAHILYNKLGRDVINFGVGGVGSVRGYLRYPISIMNYLKHTWHFKIDNPKVILAYFNEGDLKENLIAYQHYENLLKSSSKRFIKLSREQQVSETLKAMLNLEVQKKASGYDRIIEKPWMENLYFFNLIFSIIKQSLNENYRDLVKKENTLLKIFKNKELTPSNINDQSNSSKGLNNILLNGNVIQNSTPTYNIASFTNEELLIALKTLEISLHGMKQFFNDSNIYLVYLPMPALLYDYESEVLIENLGGSVHKDDITKRSALILLRLMDMCQRLDIKFVNTLPFLKEASNKEYLFSDENENHFNKRGHQLFSEAIISNLEFGF